MSRCAPRLANILRARSLRSFLGAKAETIYTLVEIAAIGAFFEVNRRENKRLKALETLVDGQADSLKENINLLEKVKNEINSVMEIKKREKKEIGELKQELETLQMRKQMGWLDKLKRRMIPDSLDGEVQ